MSVVGPKRTSGRGRAKSALHLNSRHRQAARACPPCAISGSHFQVDVGAASHLLFLTSGVAPFTLFASTHLPN